MTTIQKTSGQAGSFTFQTKNGSGSLIVPFSAPVVKWYTDTARTLNELALTVAGSGSDYTASWTAPQAPADESSRYLTVRIETSSGVFAPLDANDDIQFTTAVADPGAVVTVAEVKLRLDKTLTVDDDEIETMITAALAEYTEWVGPVSGTVVEKIDGGRSGLILGNISASTLVSAVYSDGTVIDVDDLDLDTATGIVHWGYDTAGYFTSGRRNVTITYTVAAVPANHREAIIADVAGYFAATQRGPALPGDEGLEAGWAANPLVLFPRIRALGGTGIA